jgi:hypothetical protein
MGPQRFAYCGGFWKGCFESSLSRDPFSFQVSPLLLHAPVPVHMNPERKVYAYKFFRKAHVVFFPPFKDTCYVYGF